MTVLGTFWCFIAKETVISRFGDIFYEIQNCQVSIDVMGPFSITVDLTMQNLD